MGLLAFGAVALQAEADVLVDGQVEEQRAVLGHVRQAAAGDRVGLVARHGFAEHGDDTRERRQQSGDREQRRRLAGAVRSEQRDDLARTDVQGDVAQHRDAAVAGVEPLTSIRSSSLIAGLRCRVLRCGGSAAPARVGGPIRGDAGLGLRLAGGLTEVGRDHGRVGADLAGVPWAITRPKSST